MTIAIDTAGLHPTTLSCLEALQWLRCEHSWHNVLDIGCGNGILSLAAADLCHTPGQPVKLVAADISPQAVADAQALYARHPVGHYGTVLRSEGFKDPLIRGHAPYHLIICNLLAEPITAWSRDMQTHLAPGGVCLLSGILAWLAPELEAAYTRLGFEIIHRIDRSPWVTYAMRY